MVYIVIQLLILSLLSLLFFFSLTLSHYFPHSFSFLSQFLFHSFFLSSSAPLHFPLLIFSSPRLQQLSSILNGIGKIPQNPSIQHLFQICSRLSFSPTYPLLHLLSSSSSHNTCLAFTQYLSLISFPNLNLAIFLHLTSVHPFLRYSSNALLLSFCTNC